MTSIFTPRRLGHVNLIVGELERSTEFYRSVCGLALEFSETGLRGNFMGTGNTHHDVGVIERTVEDRYGKDGHLQIPKEAAATVRLNHIAWEMDNELELARAYERAQAAGVPLARISDHQITHSIYLRDPDGNMVEFYADVIKDWRSVLHGEVDHITSVWRPDANTASAEPCWEEPETRRRVEGAQFHPARLSHAVLATQRLEEMTGFYQRVAGLSPVYADQQVALLRASLGDSPYHLAIVRTAAEKSLHHFSFEVDGAEIDAGAYSGPLKRSVFVTDPDGFRIEFFARTGNDYALLNRGRGAGLPLMV